MDKNALLAQSLAPEDIQRGDFVAVLSIIVEQRPFLLVPGEKLEIQRAATLPEQEQMCTGRVLAVCLPFVLVETPEAETITLDVRRQRLARVAPAFGRLIFRRARKDQPAGPAKGEKAEADCPGA